jgi:hypothetical protein
MAPATPHKTVEANRSSAAIVLRYGGLAAEHTDVAITGYIFNLTMHSLLSLSVAYMQTKMTGLPTDRSLRFA